MTRDISRSFTKCLGSAAPRLRLSQHRRAGPAGPERQSDPDIEDIEDIRLAVIPELEDSEDSEDSKHRGSVGSVGSVGCQKEDGGAQVAFVACWISNGFRLSSWQLALCHRRIFSLFRMLV